MIPIKSLTGTKGFMQKFIEVVYVAHYGHTGNTYAFYSQDQLKNQIKVTEIFQGITPVAIFKITRYKQDLNQ